MQIPKPYSSDRPKFNDCWNQIGVKGDGSCPELETAIHCRNCPVYSAAGRGLLEREAPPGYLEEWTALLAQTEETQGKSSHRALQGISTTRSLAIFRIAQEWLALPANCFKTITHPTPIHTLPHRSNKLFLGLVNIWGEILTCVSLSQFLGIDTQVQTSPSVSPVAYPRMVVVEGGGCSWVFSVDEVYGVHRPQEGELTAAPAVVAKAQESYTIGTLNWQDKKVSYLDADLLFYSLSRRVL